MNIIDIMKTHSIYRQFSTDCIAFIVAIIILYVKSFVLDFLTETTINFQRVNSLARFINYEIKTINLHYLKTLVSLIKFSIVSFEHRDRYGNKILFYGNRHDKHIYKQAVNVIQKS